MKRRYPFLAALICIPMLLLGQMDWSIDGMGVVLQSDHSNPASFNYSGWHIGFPSLAANVYHTGPAYNDLINRRDGLPILQTSRLIGNIADVNRTESNLRVQTLKIKHQGVKWSFGFEHEIRFYSQGEYPANLIKLYVEGNHQWIGEEVELAPKTTTFSYNNWAGSVSFTFGGTTIG
ncbi:MAG: DUF5723 family protein, partial [Saprospiraceae bacterium]|nr:DUF5723 family protein [Saprospiraceae bacterium]